AAPSRPLERPRKRPPQRAMSAILSSPPSSLCAACGKREGHVLARAWLGQAEAVGEVPDAANRDGDVLPAVHLVDRGDAFGGGGQLVLPQYLAGRRVAGAEGAVGRGADEQQTGRS